MKEANVRVWRLVCMRWNTLRQKRQKWKKEILNLSFHLSEHMKEIVDFGGMWILHKFYFTSWVKNWLLCEEFESVEFYIFLLVTKWIFEGQKVNFTITAEIWIQKSINAIQTLHKSLKLNCNKSFALTTVIAICCSVRVDNKLSLKSQWTVF